MPSPGFPAEQSARQCEMGLVDHPAVERDRAGAGVLGKDGNNLARPGKFFFAGGKGVVDYRNLRRMDRHLGGEARSPRRRGLGSEPRRVVEVRVDRVDRHDAGSRCPQQAERSRQPVNVVIGSVRPSIAAAETSRQILRTQVIASRRAETPAYPPSANIAAGVSVAIAMTRIVPHEIDVATSSAAR